MKINQPAIGKGLALFKKFTSRYGIICVLAVLMVVCSILSPFFLTANNLLNVLRQVCVVALLAFAEAVLIISGNIDLSVGSTMCLAGILSISVYVSTGNILLSILFSMLAAVICNLVIGLMIALFNLPSFVVTLAMMMMARGAVLVYTGGVVITQMGDGGYKIMGQGYIGFIPIPVLVMLAAAAVLWIVLEKTRFGRNLFAVGGNPDAARASGIDLKKYRIYSFLFAGLFVGLAGFMFTSRLNSGQPLGGAGYEGQAISAAIIGGVGFTGGTGSAWGVLVGALIMGIISNILNLMKVDSYVQQIINGAIIVVAVILDLQTKKRKLGH
jgi:inositol transport system permease protein